MNTQDHSSSPPMQLPQQEHLEEDVANEIEGEGEEGIPKAPLHQPSPLDQLVETEKLNRRRKDFPWKLHTMLEEVEQYNQQHIVSWQSDGTCFRVFRPEELVQHLLPHYFHQTQYRSFQRMLNLYEFQKILSGKYRGSYSHPKFLRNNKELCLEMRIRKRPKKGSSGASSKKAPPTSGRSSNLEKKQKAVSTGSSGGTRLTPLQHHHLQQHLMKRGGLVHRSSSNSAALLTQQQQPNLLRQGDVLDFSIYHPMMASNLGTMMPASDTSFTDTPYGLHGSSSMLPIDTDPASLHHHQSLLQNFALKSDGDYQSQKIQLSQRSPESRPEPAQQGLHHMLPVTWNHNVNQSTSFQTGQTLHAGKDESAHVTSELATRQKALNDPSSMVAPLSARLHPLFDTTTSQRLHQAVASAMPPPPSFAQSMAFGTAQQQQQQQMTHIQHGQQQQPRQDPDDSMFDLPLSSDLEPNPFP